MLYLCSPESFSLYIFIHLSRGIYPQVLRGGDVRCGRTRAQCYPEEKEQRAPAKNVVLCSTLDHSVHPPLRSYRTKFRRGRTTTSFYTSRTAMLCYSRSINTDTFCQILWSSGKLLLSLLSRFQRLFPHQILSQRFCHWFQSKRDKGILCCWTNPLPGNVFQKKKKTTKKLETYFEM